MVLRRDPSSVDTTIDLALLRDALKAARGRIVSAALVAAVLVGGAVGWRAEPVVVEARILVEPLTVPGASPSNAPEQGRATRDDRLIASQMSLLSTTGLLRRAISTAAADPTLSLAVLDDLDRSGDGLDRDERRLAALRAALTLERVDRSRLVALRLTTVDPRVGERLLAAVWEEYSAGLAEARARAEAEADRRRGDEVKEARRRLAEAEAPSVPVVPVIAPPEDPESTAIRAERVEAEQRLRRLEDFAAAGEAGAARAVDAGPTEGLRQLRERRSQLRARIAELSIVYLENHPLLKEATERLADLRQEFRSEVIRAVAAQKAVLATLDRRLAERPAATRDASLVPEPAATTTVADPSALRLALAEALARRQTAFAEALGQAAVQVGLIGTPRVVEAPAPTRPFVAGGLAALLGAGLAALLSVLFAVPATRRLDVAAPTTPIPVTDVADATSPAPVAPSRWIDPDAARRAALYGDAVETRIADLWEQIEAEIPRGRRIVVTSVTDAARAHAAARLLWANAADDQASACLVDLAATVPAGAAASPGFADIHAGRAVFSEAIYHDHDCGGWVVPAGLEPLAPETFGDDGVTGILDALASTWADLVLDVGRLEPGEGLATLLIGADVIVLAEDDRDDPRVLRALDALLMADKAVWLLDPPLDESVDEETSDRHDRDDEAAWDVAA